MLRYVIIFSAHLILALKVQAQCESPAVGENRIMNEISDQQTFPEGSTVKFKCSTGYIPVRTSASRSITCIGNQWSKLQLQCKKKSCGNPGEILHGKYSFPEGILYGATIKAQCNEGYQLIGYQVRNCRETGWDKRHPVCEVVKCINPPSIPDGVFEPEEEVYNYGDGVYYSCRRGLDLFGPSLLTCSSDGTFQPAPPRCLFVTCERPEILNAVRVEGKSPPYKYRDFVRYRCNKGYKMEGSDFLICKEDGWDPPPPQCTIVTCFPPPLIHHGQFSPQKELYVYGNRVTFTCNERFKLTGPVSSSCTEHGIFHPSPPQCQEIFCDPQTIQNAVIVGNSSLYRYNDSVQIRCKKGYKTVGSDRLTCGVNGWSPGFSPCAVVTCERPEILNAVRVEGKSASYKYEDIVRYRCNKGYKMEGSDRMICKEDGWDPPPPQCT
ncbi:complement receptor type 1-like, partial [Tachysurus ichikawai]